MLLSGLRALPKVARSSIEGDRGGFVHKGPGGLVCSNGRRAGSAFTLANQIRVARCKFVACPALQLIGLDMAMYSFMAYSSSMVARGIKTHTELQTNRVYQCAFPV